MKPIKKDQYTLNVSRQAVSRNFFITFLFATLMKLYSLHTNVEWKLAHK